ncbi:vegetative cell wall protein gp1-like [Iris pallida]|uniref:Vegetative cell wall protein gp1-like n=1 Tax=Iris pallida TaxID=29817 RepID=A0AAX6DRS2_IRIPA|nr:vegetative cell wall protein gp1-like [Iris pallida]
MAHGLLDKAVVICFDCLYPVSRVSDTGFGLYLVVLWNKIDWTRTHGSGHGWYVNTMTVVMIGHVEEADSAVWMATAEL